MSSKKKFGGSKSVAGQHVTHHGTVTPREKSTPDTPGEAAELDQHLHNLQSRTLPAQYTETLGEAPGVPGEKRNRFPVKLIKPHPYDNAADIKKSLVKPETGATPFGLATITDQDVEWLDSKRQAQQYANLHAWLDTYYDMKDPAIAEMVARIMPEYFDRREAVIDDQADLQKQIAKIRLRGPTSREDLITLFAIQSDALPVPRGPLWNPGEWYPDKDDLGNKGFIRGLFNPKRYWAAKHADATDRHDPLAASGFGGAGINNWGFFGINKGDQASKPALNWAGKAPQGTPSPYASAQPVNKGL